MLRLLAALVGLCSLTLQAQPDGREYRRRVELVRRQSGFAALWDFVNRAPDGRFAAWVPRAEIHDLRLDAVNYVREYWGAGRAATYDDFPLLTAGPFGRAVRFRAESNPDFRPCLLVPRARLHDSGIDAKGPGQSVSMVVWLAYESGNHAIAGIWHEGTDLRTEAPAAARVEAGRRQYALFAGLAGLSGAPAVHLSENGAASFGDRYARNMATAPRRFAVSPAWSTAAFSFDARRHTATTYLNGVAEPFWIENPESHPFYQWAARAWRQAELRRQPGLQPGEDPAFPAGQLYQPPERHPRQRRLISATATERVEEQLFQFTRVRVTYHRQPGHRWAPFNRELIALSANPFWFNHPIWSPPDSRSGGPFTIGRVIHSGRSGAGLVGAIGGVAVFRSALSPGAMRRLAALSVPLEGLPPTP